MGELNEEDRASLFGDIPEAKKRKFILVDDPAKGGRVRVRVTLDTVDIKEIPDSFRRRRTAAASSRATTRMIPWRWRVGGVRGARAR
jgi:hypothetical protein